MDASDDGHGWILAAVDAYELPLVRYARRLLGDVDLAADAVQHAFVQLCGESRTAVGDHLAPWLFRVCRNQALDHLRRAGREQSLVDAEADGAVEVTTRPRAHAPRPRRPARPSVHPQPALERDARRTRHRLTIRVSPTPHPDLEETGAMNDHETVREQRDALLTAYALDAVTPEQRAAVERLLAEPANAAARVHMAEVRATAAALKVARDADMPAPSPDLRRAVLAAAAGRGDVTPAKPANSRGRGGLGKWVLALGTCAAVCLLVAGLTLPAIQRTRETPRRQVALVEDREAAVRLVTVAGER